MNSIQLQNELAALNKLIFETAVKENAGRYKVNENVAAVENNITETIENEKIKAKIVSVNAMIDFHTNRGIIVKCKTPKNKRLNRLYNL